MAVRQQALLQLMAAVAAAGLALLVVTALGLLEDRVETERRHQFLVLA
jgi:UDP-N-acetylmuramyl pentapeptide phosphotransferase/UDP-N-acetylglucosamine-1-phosphate transferase